MERAAATIGSGTRILECDLSQPESIASMLASIIDERWDGLVLNAASYSRFDPEGVMPASHAAAGHAARIAMQALKEAESHFRVNASAALALCLGLAPALARSTRAGGGSIVALGDIHAHERPVRGFTPYQMSKAALMHMVEALAVELAPRVRVNSVDPGVVAWPESVGAEERRAYEAKVPLGRSGTPVDAAEAISWLLLDATYITGAHLPVDGGRRLR